MVRHNDYLDVIFDNARTLMDSLVAEQGEFTNQDFLKEAIRVHPGAYIDFLYAVKQERGEQYAFNIVHQAIGNRLSTEAQRAGFQQIKTEGRQEKTIFDTDTAKVIYSR